MVLLDRWLQVVYGGLIRQLADLIREVIQIILFCSEDNVQDSLSVSWILILISVWGHCPMTTTESDPTGSNLKTHFAFGL